MLLNESTALLSPKILLVPYESHHVPTYHEWMQDEEIRIATASEPLTLDEEYDMQRSWRNDSDKLTFIVCLPVPLDRASIVATVDDAPECMIGDINLFLSEDENASSDSSSSGTFVPDRGYAGKMQLVGEVELMIARKEFQEQGLGRAAVLMFLWFIVMKKDDIVSAHCGSAAGGVLRYLRVKIHQSNVRSIGLFESLLFRRRSETPNYFGEIELVLDDLDVVRMYGLMKSYGIEGGKKLKYESA